MRRFSTVLICFSLYLYRDRDLVERFFNKIGNVAASRPGTTSSRPTIVKLACIRLWLRVYEAAA